MTFVPEPSSTIGLSAEDGRRQVAEFNKLQAAARDAAAERERIAHESDPAVRLLYTVENVVVPLLERITRAVERDATAL